MTITQYDFFYDSQQIRFISQIVRAFSGFSYQTGMVAGQPPQTILVPCRVASSNRMVANIVSNLSENTLLSVPLITVFQTGLRGRREDLQNPGFVDTRQVYERSIVNGVYSTERGNAYSVDRIMPLPFTMDVQVDIWTSNLQQKYMLIEQILPVIYPQFEIQNSSNALDWTAVTMCMVDDELSFSSRTIPVGSSEEIDVMTINLKLPIWLSAPAKVKQISQIEEIVTNVAQGEVDLTTGSLAGGMQFTQTIVTPDDAVASVDGNVITLLGAKQSALLPDGTVPSWFDLIQKHGYLSPTISKVKLFINGDIEGAYVTGSLQYGPVVNQLLWTIDVDTLPSNTLTAIDAVIDPLRSSPGSGGLPEVADGQRYLLISDVGNCMAWGSLAARTNDIIQYSAATNMWGVSFNSTITASAHYILNSHSGRQLRWTGSEWAMSIDGVYEPGFWRLAVTPTAAQN